LALIGGGILTGRLFPGKSEKAPVEITAAPQSEPDTTDDKAWRKRYPWLFRDSTLAPYRDLLLRRFLNEQGSGLRGLRKHAGFLEAVVPRGRPVHEAAWAFETLCAAIGMQILQGRELDPPGERVEYRVQAGAAAPMTLRISLGKVAQAGTVRLALVLIGLDSVRGDAARRLLDFPIPLTLVVSAGDSSPPAAHWGPFPTGKEMLLELPMEPSSYPYVKPGPGALFIHHGREDVERLMGAKLRRFPEAKGFATTFGDRAIENRPLLENVMRFAARRSRVFLDLTESPRSLTASASLKTGAAARIAHVQDLQGAKALDAELARRCALAQKAGEGIWVLRYSRTLPTHLERLLGGYTERFEEMGLEWVAISGLRQK
jgi:polysaccharide deacetylase 2 family uncharacterized protein YibQ